MKKSKPISTLEAAMVITGIAGVIISIREVSGIRGGDSIGAWIDCYSVITIMASGAFMFYLAIYTSIQRKQREKMRTLSGGLDTLCKNMTQEMQMSFNQRDVMKLGHILSFLRTITTGEIKESSDGLLSTLLSNGINPKRRQQIWFTLTDKPKDAKALWESHNDLLDSKNTAGKTLLVLAIEEEGWLTVEFLLGQEGINLEGVPTAIANIGELPTNIFFRLNRVAPPEIKAEFAEPSTKPNDENILSG